LALRANGTVVHWGDITRGPVPTGLSNVVAVAVSFFSVALKSDGTVVVWAAPQPEISNIPPAATNIMAIGAAPGAIIGLRHDGSLIAWGWDQRLTALPPNLSNVVQIAVGPNHAWARKSDGSIVGWGANFDGQAVTPPGLGPVLSIEAGQSTSFAVKPDFTIHRWGGPDENEVPPGITGIAEV
ncbi:MAG TPA: RCC1 domain-containing protein, partial [Candidatus Kapabacteria bacterium]|nr:RCC1 domain-containing protein [Candidatus Kapabacteria bacterium]